MIIGLLGSAGSGKNTAGNILVEYGYKQYSFASTLKDVVSTIFGWDRLLLEGDTIESREFRETIDPFWSTKFGYDVTPRSILQRVGTEAFRDVILDSIWIDSLEHQIGNSDVVLMDCRFSNEIEWIKSKNGIIIEVKRDVPEYYQLALSDNTRGTTYMKQSYPDIHISEWGWIGNKNIDYVLYNNSDINTLKSNIDSLYKEIKSS